MGSVFCKHKRTQRVFGRASSPCLPPGFHIHFQEQALLHYEKSILWLIIVVKQRVRPAFVAVCMSTVNKVTLQFENFYFLCGTVVLTFDAMVSTGFVFWMNVLQFKTIPLLCKGADYLTDELPVQSFVILRKRNNLYFWLGFTRNQVFLSTGC